MVKLEYIIVIAIRYKKSVKLVILDTLMDMEIVLIMEQSEYLDIIPQRPVSMADMLLTHKVDDRTARQKFIDEAFVKLNQARKGKFYSMDKKRIAIMINQMCPKVGGDSFVIDTQKSCQEADLYWVAFWGIYNKAVGRKSKKMVK